MSSTVTTTGEVTTFIDMASQRMPKASLRPPRGSSSQSAGPLPHHIASTLTQLRWLPYWTLFTRCNLTSVPCLEDAFKASPLPSTPAVSWKARNAPSVEYGGT